MRKQYLRFSNTGKSIIQKIILIIFQGCEHFSITCQVKLRANFLTQIKNVRQETYQNFSEVLERYPIRASKFKQLRNSPKYWSPDETVQNKLTCSLHCC